MSYGKSHYKKFEVLVSFGALIIHRLPRSNGSSVGWLQAGSCLFFSHGSRAPNRQRNQKAANEG